MPYGVNAGERKQLFTTDFLVQESSVSVLSL